MRLRYPRCYGNPSGRFSLSSFAILKRAEPQTHHSRAQQYNRRWYINVQEKRIILVWKAQSVMQIASTIKGALTSYTDTAEFMHEFHKLNNMQLIAVSARSKPCSRVARRRSRHLPLLPEHLSNSVRTWD